MDKEQVAKIAKALADPTRVEIFRLISRSPDTICSAVVSHCDLSPATISHHLRVLSEAGLIETRREGQFIHNRAMPDTLKAYAQALTRLGNGKRDSRRG